MIAFLSFITSHFFFHLAQTTSGSNLMLCSTISAYYFALLIKTILLQLRAMCVIVLKYVLSVLNDDPDRNLSSCASKDNTATTITTTNQKTSSVPFFTFRKSSTTTHTHKLICKYHTQATRTNTLMTKIKISCLLLFSHFVLQTSIAAAAGLSLSPSRRHHTRPLGHFCNQLEFRLCF